MILHTKTICSTFGLVFQDAAEKTRARMKHDSFESSVVQVRREDISEFLEHIQTHSWAYYNEYLIQGLGLIKRNRMEMMKCTKINGISIDLHGRAF